MQLQEYAAQQKRAIFARLEQGQPPEGGEFDESLFRQAKDEGRPQVGTTIFEPQQIHFEFIYHIPGGANRVLRVTQAAPQRIVYLPVPKWVIQTIWQGEVSGSFHFEADAMRLAEEFMTSLEPAPNEELFKPGGPERKE